MAMAWSLPSRKTPPPMLDGSSTRPPKIETESDSDSEELDSTKPQRRYVISVRAGLGVRPWRCSARLRTGRRSSPVRSGLNGSGGLEAVLRSHQENQVLKQGHKLRPCDVPGRASEKPSASPFAKSGVWYALGVFELTCKSR